MFGENMWGIEMWGGAPGRYYWKQVLSGFVSLIGGIAGGLALTLTSFPRLTRMTADGRLVDFAAAAKITRFSTEVRRDDRT